MSLRAWPCSGLREANVRAGDVVMIYGCGPIARWLYSLPWPAARRLSAWTSTTTRPGLATKLGAIGVNSTKDYLHEIVKKTCGERGGVDVIIEVSGAGAIYDDMADYLRKEGKIMLLAHPGERVSFDIMKTMHHSGATIKGIFGRRIWDTWYALSDMVASGKVDLTKVITHRFPLSAANEAFEQISAGAGKVIFLPEQE